MKPEKQKNKGINLLSPNVNSLDTAKFVAKKRAWFSTLSLAVGTQLSRSHFTVTVSSEFSVISVKHCASFHVRCKSVTMCHQVCFVRIGVDKSMCRLLLLHDILHEHVLQHHMLHPT